MQEGATAHTANNFANAEASGERMWPLRSPDLNHCDFHSRGTLKDKEFVKNSHPLREPKKIFGKKLPLRQENNLAVCLEHIFKT
jgi:hypothetical protein